MKKEQLMVLLSKAPSDLTDQEITDLLAVDSSFWPETSITEERLVAEQVGRKRALRILPGDMVQDAAYLSLLKHLRSFGPNVFKEIDELGRDHLSAEISVLEKTFVEKLKKFKEQA